MPFLLDAVAIAAFRRALDAAGFAVDAVRRTVGAVGDGMVPRGYQVPLIERRLDDGALATLIRLFVLGTPVSGDAARKAFAPLPLERCIDLGLVARRGQRVLATARLIPGADFVVACDREPADPGATRSDHVMGIAASSRLLSNLTPRRDVDLALDLGTGCGYQALLAAAHARRVIATDVNPRALGFTAFNALLNGHANIECRLGDRFEAVEGLSFDLIVSNPPFVISPDRDLTYRDSGLGADRVSRELVEQAPRHLRDGGLAHVLISWLHLASGDWAAPLRTWVAGIGADAWFLRAATHDPLGYAASWHQPLLGDPLRHATAMRRWLDYFADLGAEAIGYGAAILRRRDGPSWTRADDMPEAIGPDAGDDIAALLAADDRLRASSDEQLLAAMLEVEPAHRLEQVMRWRGGAFTVDRAALVRDHGLRPSATIDVLTAQLVAAVGDGRPLHAAIDAAAEAIGGASERDTFDRAALAAARRLIAHGFLRFSDPPR